VEDLEVEEMVEEAKAVGDLEVDWAEEVMVVVMVEEKVEEVIMEDVKEVVVGKFLVL
jgi:hypothetical protein